MYVSREHIEFLDSLKKPEAFRFAQYMFIS